MFPSTWESRQLTPSTYLGLLQMRVREVTLTNNARKREGVETRFLTYNQNIRIHADDFSSL